MRRIVALDGCLNFRDLGGYPTGDGRRLRWRRVFRSDALDGLTAGDVALLREEIGLDVVVDLRSTAEVRAGGEGPLVRAGLRHHHLPLFDGETKSEPMAVPITLADRYVLLAEFAKAKIGRVLEVLADATGPAVYHCAAGKDRTGVISAIVLGVLGVPDEAIVADYAATKENLDAIVERLLATKGYEKMLAALPPDTLHAEAETMVAFLSRMRHEYGSIRRYAQGAGVSEDALDRLAGRLVE